MSRIVTLLLSAAVCAVMPTTSARAQDSMAAATLAAPSLQSLLLKGRLVRLHLYDGRTLRGHVAALTDTTVTMSPCSACANGTFRLAAIAGVDTRIGRSHRVRHAVTGALLGGAALAGALVVAGTQSDRGCHDGPCGVWIVAVPPAFALGAFTGGIVGALLPAERWGPTPFMYQPGAVTPSM